MPDTATIRTTAAERVGRAIADRLDRELRAAWHAGYPWLYVLEPYPMVVAVGVLPSAAALYAWNGTRI